MYLYKIERKLQKIKKEAKLVDALAVAKERCLRELLNQSSSSHNESSCELLENSILDQNSSFQEVLRHLQPVQAVSSGELAQILHYDHLELSLREEGDTSATETEDGQPVRVPFKRINH